MFSTGDGVDSIDWARERVYDEKGGCLGPRLLLRVEAEGGQEAGPDEGRIHVRLVEGQMTDG